MYKPFQFLCCKAYGGAFTVNILGRKGHAVALDEAHEMCINKDMKYPVVRPSKEYLQ